MSQPNIQNYINDYPGDWPIRNLSQLQFLAICHTASPLAGKSLRTICDQINGWHKNNGWPCISYHYVISQDGSIAKCNTEESASYTVGTYNWQTICVCLDGNFETDIPTPEQLTTLDQFLHWMVDERGDLPFDRASVVGHNEIDNTACPGQNLIPLIAKWKQTGSFGEIQQTNNQPSPTHQPQNMPDFKQSIIDNLKGDPHFYPQRQAVFEGGDAQYFAQEFKMGWQSEDNLNAHISQLEANPKVVFQDDPAKDAKISELNNLISEYNKMPNQSDEIVKLKSQLLNTQKQLDMVTQASSHPELLGQVQDLQNQILDLQVKNKNLEDERADWEKNALVKTITRLGNFIKTPDQISQQIAVLLYNNDIMSLLKQAYYGYVYQQQIQDSKKEVVSVSGDIQKANNSMANNQITPNPQIVATVNSTRPFIIRIISGLATFISTYSFLILGFHVELGNAQINNLADVAISLLVGTISHIIVYYFQWQNQTNTTVNAQNTDVNGQKVAVMSK